MTSDLMQAMQANLLSPAVLFFLLGVFATLCKSDLKFPEPLYLGLTIYLLTAIGFKGGVSIARAGISVVWWPALMAVTLSALIPLWSYPVLRWLGRLSPVDSAAVSAHYGSVSAVTFLAATNFLKSVGQPFEEFASAFLAVMEAPAIVIGVVLGKLATQKPGESFGPTLKVAFHEALLGRSVILLVGGLRLVTCLASGAMRPRLDSLSVPFRACWRCSCWRWDWSRLDGSVICARWACS